MVVRCQGVRVIPSCPSVLYRHWAADPKSTGPAYAGRRDTLNFRSVSRVSEDKREIVQRRQRYIERQRAMHPETVDVRFRNARPEGDGPPNRHGMPVVPVGQHLVKNWPVLDLGEQPEIPLEQWRLEVTGLVEN